MTAQIYIYISEDGITDWETTGDEPIDIIYVNWESVKEDFSDYNQSDIQDIHTRLQRIQNKTLRESELTNFNELIKQQREWERLSEEQAVNAQAKRLVEARRTLKEAGEL